VDLVDEADVAEERHRQPGQRVQRRAQVERSVQQRAGAGQERGAPLGDLGRHPRALQAGEVLRQEDAGVEPAAQLPDVGRAGFDAVQR
jgi:hypothetical protein